MSNNNNTIERREITPFDMMDDTNRDDPRILDLDNESAVREGLQDPPQVGDQDPPEGDQDPPQVGDQDPPEDDQDPPKDDQDPPKGDDQDPPEDEFDVKINANLAKYAAEAMKANGALPEDFEISDDITEEALDKAYIDFKEEVLRNEIRREELERLAREEGITQEMVDEMKLKYYGVQDKELKQVQLLQYLGNYQFDPKSETFEQEARNFLSDYYTIKEYNPDRIGVMVDTDINDENVHAIIEAAQKDLADKGASMYQGIKTKADEVRQAALDKKAAARQNEQKLLESGEIGGVKYTPDEIAAVRRALYEKTELVIGPDGKRYKTTLYNKKRMEAAQNLEKSLQSKILFILDGNLQVKNKQTEKITNKVLGRLNQYVDIDVKKPSKNKKPNSTAPVRSEQGDDIQRVAVN